MCKPVRSRKARPPKIKGPSEHVIQCRLVGHLQYALKPELEFRAIPNGGLRKKSVAIKLKAEGVKSGTPDTFVTLPAGKIGWLELKTDIGVLSQEQKNFRDKVVLLGHLWAMARSVEEALIILTAWDALRQEYRVEGPGQMDMEEAA